MKAIVNDEYGPPAGREAVRSTRADRHDLDLARQSRKDEGTSRLA